MYIEHVDLKVVDKRAGKDGCWACRDETKTLTKDVKQLVQGEEMTIKCATRNEVLPVVCRHQWPVPEPVLAPEPIAIRNCTLPCR